MALFESYERRIDQINAVLNSYGISSIEEAEKITKDAGLNVYDQVKKIQPICFENACWAYTVGAAIAIKKGCKRAADAAAAIGEGLQAFCIPGSVADHRKVGLGHGNLGKMLLEEETECFCFLAGHESFAAAEGAIGIAEKANKVRQKPLRVILNGLGKDAAQIISRINGFTFVETEYDPYTNEVKENLLGVSHELLEEKTAFCEEVAKEMVLGAIKALNVDFAISATGVSGPTGGTPSAPVGTIFLGFGSKDDVRVVKLTEDFGRDINLAIATNTALKGMLDFLKEHAEDLKKEA